MSDGIPSSGLINHVLHIGCKSAYSFATFAMHQLEKPLLFVTILCSLVDVVTKQAVLALFCGRNVNVLQWRDGY